MTFCFSSVHSQTWLTLTSFFARLYAVLAQEILGEVSPDELEEIEVCFGTLEVPVGGQDAADGGDGADELEILEVAAEA